MQLPSYKVKHNWLDTRNITQEHQNISAPTVGLMMCLKKEKKADQGILSSGLI